jgi:hypothetical protein
MMVTVSSDFNCDILYRISRRQEEIPVGILVTSAKRFKFVQQPSLKLGSDYAYGEQEDKY